MKEFYINQQKEICKKYNATYFESPDSLKVGIARNVKEGVIPINGLRHSPENGTTGWYIWSGEEFSTDPDFFMPLHVKHLEEWCPAVIKYLALPPGYRFLIASDYEDVWEDTTLLNLKSKRTGQTPKRDRAIILEEKESARYKMVTGKQRNTRKWERVLENR